MKWISFFIILLTTGCGKDFVPASIGVSLKISSPNGIAITREQMEHVEIRVINDSNKQQMAHFSFDKCDGEAHCGGGRTSFPDPVIPGVLLGQKILIQVIVAVSLDSTQATTASGQPIDNYSDEFYLYYKSQVFTIDKVNNEAYIVMNASNTQGLSQTRRVKGRFLSHNPSISTSSLTGKVEILYTPLGELPMLIGRSEMFNGFFEFFMFTNVNLEYRINNSNRIFTGSVNSILSNPNSPHLQISYPDYFQSQSNEVRKKTGRKDILAILGAVSESTPNLCFPASTSFPNYIYTSSSSGSGQSLVWGSGQIYPSDMIRANTSCAGQEYVDYLKYLPFNISQNDGAEVGFKGPFKIYDGLSTSSSSSNFFNISYNASSGSAIFQWKYLPGVFDKKGPEQIGIDGTDIMEFFATDSSNPSNSNELRDFRDPDDGYRCGDMAISSRFSVYSTSISSDKSSGQRTLTNITSNSASQRFFIFCPFKLSDGQKVYFNTTIQTSLYSTTVTN